MSSWWAFRLSGEVGGAGLVLGVPWWNGGCSWWWCRVWCCPVSVGVVVSVICRWCCLIGVAGGCPWVSLSVLYGAGLVVGGVRGCVCCRACSLTRCGWFIVGCVVVSGVVLSRLV